MDGNDIWEALFGILKGDVPDELTEDVCQQLAAALAQAPQQPDAADQFADEGRCPGCGEYVPNVAECVATHVEDEAPDATVQEKVARIIRRHLPINWRDEDELRTDAYATGAADAILAALSGIHGETGKP